MLPSTGTESLSYRSYRRCMLVKLWIDFQFHLSLSEFNGQNKRERVSRTIVVYLFVYAMTKYCNGIVLFKMKTDFPLVLQN